MRLSGRSFDFIEACRAIYLIMYVMELESKNQLKHISQFISFKIFRARVSGSNCTYIVIYTTFKVLRVRVLLQFTSFKIQGFMVYLYYNNYKENKKVYDKSYQIEIGPKSATHFEILSLS